MLNFFSSLGTLEKIIELEIAINKDLVKQEMIGYASFIMQENSIRIIFITHYTELYGANRSLLNLLDGLGLIGINNILVLTPNEGKINEELKKRNIQTQVIPFKNEIHYQNKKKNLLKEYVKFFFNWYVVSKYGNKLGINNNTIIHTNTSVTFFGAYLSDRFKISHVWHIREFGGEDYNIKYNYGYKHFQKWLNRASAAIAISKSIFTKRVINAASPIKETIYNGVIFSNEIKELPIKNDGEANAKITFGIIGVISKEKGQEDAIKALMLLKKKISNIQLIIAGGGESSYIKKLKTICIEQDPLEYVKFIGFVENTDLFYSDIDCLLMCSRNEALGRVTIEAMSKGIPVIGFDNAGTSEIIKDGYNGFVYKDGVEELADKMEIVINNKDIKASIILNALKTVKQNFTIEKYADAVAEIYQHVLNK